MYSKLSEIFWTRFCILGTEEPNLLSYLIKLGQNVEIMVTNQQPDKSQPKINVVYQKIA